MSNLLLGYSNLIDSATLSGGSWSGTLPLNNLKNRVLTTVARSSDATTGSTKFDMDFGSAQSVGVFALVNHNITVSGTPTFRLRGASASDFLSGVVYDSGAGGTAVWAGGETAASTSTYRKTLFHHLGGHFSARYWRLEITDTSNADTYVQAGRVFIGPYWQPTINMSIGAELGFIDRDEIDEADSGAEYFSDRPSPRVARFSIEFLSLSESMASAYELQRIASTSNEVLFMTDPADATNRTRFSWLGRLRARQSLRYASPDRLSAQFDVKELL